MRQQKLEESGVTGYLAKGDVDETLRIVLEHGISPYSVQATQMKAMLKMRQGRHSEAEPVIAATLSMRDADPITWKMKGDCAYLQCKYEESENAYRKALSLSPNSPEVLHDLAVSIVSQGRVDESLSYFEQAIKAAPERADFNHHYALMLVLAGQDEAGWDRMQWRLRVQGVCGTFPFPDKYWKGEDLAGKTIVVRSEQGWGDTIMFARYFPWFLERAAKVYFYGQRAMMTFIQEYYPSIVCWPNDAPVPIDFDYHVSIMCLPRLIGEVQAPQPKAEKGDGVGVCWFGSPTHKADHLRSVPIEMFAPLAEVIDKPLYSLGYGYFWNLDQNGIGVSDNKPDFMEYCITDKKDWAETARFVRGLDLVITVDTAIAHLAGFLGVETWLLLPKVPDFRWGMKGERTKWYPSVKLYRQEELLKWEPVFKRVEEDLRARFSLPSRAEGRAGVATLFL